MNSVNNVIEPNEYFIAPDGVTTLKDLNLLCKLAERKRSHKQKYVNAVTNIRFLMSDGSEFLQAKRTEDSLN